VAALQFLLSDNILNSRKHRIKPIFPSGHANPVLKDGVCACLLDQKALSLKARFLCIAIRRNSFSQKSWKQLFSEEEATPE
jgi:hypothetical protein